eukprot:m.12062 g.12062  ORF g.12062 m.12062 type:complete len:424 (+) comp6064_c0_seq1:125-1396(+)
MDPNRSLLSAAAACDCQGIAEALAIGADVNFSEGDSTALTSAVTCVFGNAEGRDGHTKFVLAAVEKLLAAGASVNATDKDGNSALYYAVTAPWFTPDIVRALLAAGADAKLINKAQESLLHVSTTDEVVTELLLAAGADANAKNKSGQTPLFSATDGLMADMLLAAGAQARVADEDGQTPLHIAATMGRLDVVTVLLAAGADIDAADNHGDTATINAACYASSNYACLRELVLAGANLNVVNKRNYAACNVNEFYDRALILVAGGADYTHVDGRGMSGWAHLPYGRVWERPYHPGPLEAACMVREPALLLARLRDGAVPVDGRRDFVGLMQLATEEVEPLRLPVCEQTVAVVRKAALPWSRSRHHCFGAAFRSHVMQVLLIQQRLDAMWNAADDSSESSSVLPRLPAEMWLHILSFASRFDFV